MLAQPEKRLGEILFFTDMGRAGMTCDTCHVAGHTEGVLFTRLFTNAHPLRIYRSPTILGSRDTAPYFIPASTYTLEQTSRTVGRRNRYHNPNLTENEVRELTLYASTLATPPNPFVGPDGAPVAQLELPDGVSGHPRLGLALFEGKAQCSSCHPGPLFTTDQSPSTRGRYQKVGTPKYFPLRNQWQDEYVEGFPPPSLLGGWDIFPMLSSGTAGFGVAAGKLTVATRFPMRAVLNAAADLHGTTTALSPEDKNDLLAYLESL
jgi:cytochrome c peroxidase